MMDMRQFMKPSESEKPLDVLVSDGGMVGILRRIAFIGDSLSSGEFESIGEDGSKDYHDMFEYSWGQYIARMAGITAYNFSSGGMTAKWYCQSFAESRGYWSKELAAQAYVIALGVNDVLNNGWEIGSVEDIDRDDPEKNKDTFIGWMGRIVDRYKKIQPDAKFFFVTLPRDDREENDRPGLLTSAAIRSLAGFYENSYLIDLSRYAPVYDAAFRGNFFNGGHMNAAGYLFTAKMIASYMDFIIRSNFEDFSEVGFIGTPLRYKR